MSKNLVNHVRRFVASVVAILILVSISGVATAQQPVSIRLAEDGPKETDSGETESDDILDLDLDQLGKVNAVVPAFDVAVTSVTKSDSTVGKSPAAIFVVTQEMIRRSGATSIPEILRMVPGMQVAQIDSSKWAVSARGFNDRFANKLLVMVDGRSVYNALFSGVYWESIDVVLQDIDRIEVIRGPGATLWGANAVNGVINIITKSAGDTSGVLITSGTGTQDEAINVVRIGGKLRNGFDYKVFAKQFERDRGFGVTGSNDDWRMNRIGFRIDGATGANESDQWMLLGNLYEGTAGERGLEALPGFPFQQQYVQDNEMRGGHVVARWSRQHTEESSTTIQFYYDKTFRAERIGNASYDVFDLDLSRRFRLSANQMINWGLGYRRHQDFTGTNDPFIFSFTPAGRKLDNISGFVQDEIALTDKLTGFIGAKFSRNDFTGFEIQPSARVLWSISDRQVAWASISRAVRTPSRTGDIQFLSFEAPTYVRLLGFPGAESENLMAYEFGYRQQLNEHVSWDVSLFSNQYTHLRDSVITGLTPGLPPTVNVLLATVGREKTHGLEYTANIQMTDHWTVSGWYSLLSDSGELSSPSHQAYLSSTLDLPRCWELDILARYTDRIPEDNVDSYVDLDLRIGWKPNRRLQLSVVGQNMLDASRMEFIGPATGAGSTEVRRGVYGEMVWRY